MIRQVIFGLTTEGTTDERFLSNIIFRLLEDISAKSTSVFDVYPIRVIRANGNTFTDKMMDASRIAYNQAHALCVHVDADDKDTGAVMQHKIQPFLNTLTACEDDESCKIIVPTIPVQMIESWMLSDTQLFKRLIGAVKRSDHELGIDKHPESYADPKSTITKAIQKALSDKPKRRRDQISISDLYETMGYSISLDSLRRIPSFRNFENYVCNALMQLGLMR